MSAGFAIDLVAVAPESSTGDMITFGGAVDAALFEAFAALGDFDVTS